LEYETQEWGIKYSLPIPDIILEGYTILKPYHQLIERLWPVPDRQCPLSIDVDRGQNGRLKKTM
jgi:hypothetical protein